MYEVVKVVKGYEITRMVGTRGYYEVTISKGEKWSKFLSFRTIKAAVEYINNNL